jgi:hypothetical protein
MKNTTVARTSDVASVRHMQKAAIPVEAQLLAAFRLAKYQTSTELTGRSPMLQQP